MALSNSISPSELQRQFDLAYGDKIAHVMLCLAGSTGYTSATAISDWESVEVDATGYSRQSVVLGAEGLNAEESTYSSVGHGVTFGATIDGYSYDSIVVFIDGEDYPCFVSFLDEESIVYPGQSEGINFQINVSLENGVAPAEPQDPLYDNVVVLLHFEGEEGSTVFVDSGPNSFSGEKIIPYRDIKITTARSKFGNSCLYFAQTDGSLDLDINSELDFGASNFTIEFWLFALADNFQHIFSIDDEGTRRSLLIGINSNGQLFATIYPEAGGTNSVTLTSSEAVVNQGWVHVAFSRFNSIIYLHVNGIGQSKLFTGSIYYVSSLVPCIGMRTASNADDFHGFIDDFRITKGVSRYTSGSIQVPQSAFPDS